MKDNKDRKVKELALTLDDSEQITKKNKEESGKITRKSNDDSDNSFYDRQSEKESTTWTQDWRGKTLGISLAAIVLLGIGIPAGMAITGFFKKDDMSYKPTTERYVLAENLVEIWTNEAIINHYASMVYEGYITQNQYNIDIKNAEKDAEDKIDDEKSALNSQYGNTWEDKWDEVLQGKGFHSSGNGGEDEYKDSLISSKILGKEISKYNTRSTYIQEIRGGNPSDKYEYSSIESSTGNNYLVIDNTQTYDKYDKHEEEINIESAIEIDSTSFTPQDLISLYIITYEPIIYNKSRIPFSLLDENNESSLDALSITVTTENLEASLGFYNEINKATADDPTHTFEPAAEIFSGVQSQHNLSFGSDSSATIDSLAIGMHEANLKDEIFVKDESTFDLIVILESAFDDAIMAMWGDNNKKIDDLTSDDIKQMGRKKEVTDAFASSLFDSLSANGGPLAYGKIEAETSSPKTGDSVYREYYYNYDISDIAYTMYASTDGLNLVGTQLVGADLIKEQLNHDNNSVDSNVNYDVFNSYESWLTSNLSKILLWDYIYTPNNDPETDDWGGWFTTEGTLALKENIEVDDNFKKDRDIQLGSEANDNDILLIEEALISKTTKETRKSVIDNYLSTEDFIKQNEGVFGSGSFTNINDENTPTYGFTYYEWLTSSNMYNFYNFYSNSINNFGSHLSFNTKLINFKGDEE